MREYRESIILELKEISVLAANMFMQAQIHYEEGGVICLELLDTIVSEGRKEEILELLEHIYKERFRIPADIRISYASRILPARVNMMSSGFSRKSMPFSSGGTVREEKTFRHMNQLLKRKNPGKVKEKNRRQPGVLRREMLRRRQEKRTAAGKGSRRVSLRKRIIIVL